MAHELHPVLLRDAQSSRQSSVDHSLHGIDPILFRLIQQLRILIKVAVDYHRNVATGSHSKVAAFWHSK